MKKITLIFKAPSRHVAKLKPRPIISKEFSFCNVFAIFKTSLSSFNVSRIKSKISFTYFFS